MSEWIKFVGVICWPVVASIGVYRGDFFIAMFGAFFAGAAIDGLVRNGKDD